MSESILLLCAECANDDSFLIWHNPSSDTIAAQCQDCGAVQVWRNA